MSLASPPGGSPVDLVLEGGGVKAIGLAGAYAVLRERGYEPVHVAGSSAGAIVGALIAAGYGSAEVRAILTGLDFRQFRDEGWEDRLPLVRRTASLLKDLGIYEGERLTEWTRELLAAKGVSTFRDLVLDPGETDPRYRWRLQVVVSDVTARRLLVLPRDAGLLGLDPDELEVALAVRMSAGIPIFYEPIRHLHPETGETHTLVDGGMLSNFPVWLFDRPGGQRPARPTLGLLLVEPEPRVEIGRRVQRPERGVGALLDYVRALAETVMAVQDRLYLDQADFARTIAIPTLGVGVTEFDLSRERAEALYESGRAAAEAFLADWDFEAYLLAYGTGTRRSRRSGVARDLRDACP